MVVMEAVVVMMVVMIHDYGGMLTDVTRLNFFEVARAAFFSKGK